MFPCHSCFTLCSLLFICLASQSRGSRRKASPPGQNLSLTSFCLIPSSFSPSPSAHAVAPESSGEITAAGRLQPGVPDRGDGPVAQPGTEKSRLVHRFFFSFVFYPPVKRKRRWREADVFHAAGLGLPGLRDTPLTFKSSPDRSKRGKKLNRWTADSPLIPCASTTCF